MEFEIKEGRFREDLYYRLSVFPVRLPPLRERREDIPLLAKHFLDQYATAFRQECLGIAPEAMKALTAYDWPGNVRELANEIQRALVLATPGERIGLAELSEKITGTPAGTNEWKKHSVLRSAVEAVERDLIQRAFETFQGNKTHMSEQLGISRWTLLQKMRAYGIETENENEE